MGLQKATSENLTFCWNGLLEPFIFKGIQLGFNQILFTALYTRLRSAMNSFWFLNLHTSMNSGFGVLNIIAPPYWGRY